LRSEGGRGSKKAEKLRSSLKYAPYLVYLEMDAHSGNPFLNDNKVIIGASKSRWALGGKGMICFFVECHSESRGWLMLFFGFTYTITLPFVVKFFGTFDFHLAIQ